jgi:type I restriction enzyme S subunit
LAGEWPILTVAECASSEPYSTQIGPFGDKIRAENYTSMGAPVLRGTNVNPDGRFHDDDFVFIDSERATSEFGKFVCEADDVILCHKGTLGKIGIIPEKSRFKKYIMGNSMMKVRCDRSKLEPLFLYYWLSSRDGQNYIFSRVSQVGVPQIQRPLSTLREASFPVPPLAEQKAIAAVLGALDDKIELNRRMNATLEAMARALFQSWFVDFDPVRAKMDGRASAGLDSITAALFPITFQDSAFGAIPQGWEVTRLDNLASVMMGLSPDGESYNAKGIGIPLINGPVEFGDYSPVKTKWTEAATRFSAEHDLIFCVRGSTTGRRVVSDGEYGIGRGVCSIRANEGFHGFLYQTINVGLDRLLEKTTGSVFPSLSAPDIKGFPVLKPSNRVLEAYERTTRPLIQRVQQNHHQSRTLAILRDTLLPKLLSGELDVSRILKGGTRWPTTSI